MEVDFGFCDEGVVDVVCGDVYVFVLGEFVFEGVAEGVAGSFEFEYEFVFVVFDYVDFHVYWEV